VTYVGRVAAPCSGILSVITTAAAVNAVAVSADALASVIIVVSFAQPAGRLSGASQVLTALGVAMAPDANRFPCRNPRRLSVRRSGMDPGGWLSRGTCLR
jgi:hypothetical protein